MKTKESDFIKDEISKSKTNILNYKIQKDNSQNIVCCNSTYTSAFIKGQ